MQIRSWPNLGHWFLNFNAPRSTGTPPRTGPLSGSTDPRQQIRFARQKVDDLQDALQDISATWRRRDGSIASTEAASARSLTDLGLGTPTAAYLESTAEVNATATSFETHGPAWGGASTAVPTIDGEYDGSTGTGTLTFEVTRGGSVGDNLALVDVRRPDGSRLQRIWILPWHDPDRTYTLRNGLEVSFGAGDLVTNDTFTLDVFAAVGSVADPDRPFNGTRDADPNLEYGLDVTAGSFQINGEMINVAADDSINSVLASINASAAGVTATYSAATEQITLVHDTSGSGGAITLENDTSGFLAAMKLTGATLVEGQDSRVDSLMQDVPRFSGVTAGDVFVNGIAVALDPSADSLQDVIDRINASAADATASVDATGRYVTVTANDPEAQLSLDDNGRGFFPALEIAAGTFDPVTTIAESRGVTGERARKVADLMRDAAAALNALYGIAIPGQKPGTSLLKVRTDLNSAITGLLEDNGKSDLARIGIKFDWDSPTGLVFRFSGNAPSRLTGAIATRATSVQELLFATNSDRKPGFVDGLLAAVSTAANALDDELGVKGRTIDTYA